MLQGEGTLTEPSRLPSWIEKTGMRVHVEQTAGFHTVEDGRVECCSETELQRAVEVLCECSPEFC